MPRATWCCSEPRWRFGRACAGPTSWPAWAATSSPSCCPETGTESADIVIGKVRDALGRALQGLGSGTTASIGAVTADVAPTTVQLLIDRADRLTYESKGKGKNQVTHVTVTNWAA